MKKKFLALLLALAMVLPLVPVFEVPTFAEGVDSPLIGEEKTEEETPDPKTETDEPAAEPADPKADEELVFSPEPIEPAYELATGGTTGGTTGDCTWTLDGTVLTISGNGAISNNYVGGVMAPWGTSITKVIVEEGVTDLGWYAFYGSTLLKEVSLPSTLSNLGYGTFYGCTSLESIVIPDAVNHLNGNVFANCSSLKKVVIPARCTMFGAAFDGCSSLTDVWYGGSKNRIYVSPEAEELNNANWRYLVCTSNLPLGDHIIENNRCIHCQKKEFLVESIELGKTAIKIIENTHGQKNYDIAGNEYYHYSNFSPYPFTVVLKDGTRISSYSYSFNVNGDEYYLSNRSSQVNSPWTAGNQENSPWTAGNTYEYVFYVSCSQSDKFIEIPPVTASIQVTILENPVKSVSFQDQTLYDGHNGYFSGEQFIFYPATRFSVELKDGTVLSDLYSFTYEGEYYPFYTNAQELQNQSAWTAGNTYEVTAELLGLTDTFNVNVKADPILSVESFQIEDVVAFDLDADSDDPLWFPMPNFQLTMKDGSILKGEYGHIYLENIYYSFSTNADELQSQTPWVAGNTYEVTATLGGKVSGIFKVHVKENPVKSLTALSDFTFYVKNGYQYETEGGGVGYQYDLPAFMDFQIELKDGRILNVHNGEFCVDDQWIMIERPYSSSEFSEPWLPGNTYEIPAYIGDVSTTFKVTIVEENPIVSVTAKDMTLSWDVDFSTGWGIDDPVYTVTMKDGTVICGRPYELAENYGIFTQYSDDYWEVIQSFLPGNTYSLTSIVGGISVTHQVTVEGNPIQKMELIKAPEKTKIRLGENFDLFGARIRLTYTDGTYEDFRFGEHSSSLAFGLYSKRLDKYLNFFIYDGDPKKLGKQELTLSCNVGGEVATCIVSYEVVEASTTWESISIENASDNSVTLRITCSDRSIVEAKILMLEYASYNSNSPYQSYDIFTDQGIFTGNIIMNDGYRIELFSPDEDHLLVSNTLPECPFLKIYAFLLEDMEPYAWPTAFNGTVTKKNVDWLIYASLAREDLLFEKYIFTQKEVRDLVSKYFSIENLDLNLSRNYHAESDTYFVDYLGAGAGVFYEKLIFEDGVWKVTVFSYETATQIYLEFSEDLKISHICQNHNFDNACDPTCNECGATRTDLDHVYDHDYDAVCNECGFERVVSGTTGDCTWTLDGTVLTVSGNGQMGTQNAQYSDGTYTTLAPWGTYLTKVILEEGVTSIGKLSFAGCRSLTSVTIPKSVIYIGSYAFSDCTELASIEIPDGVLTIDYGAFRNCDRLTAITIPKSVTSIESSAFAPCENLTTIKVARDNPVYHSSGNCIIETKSKTLIHGCNNSVIPADGSVTSLGSQAFIYCNGLTSITIPDNVITIGNSAFASCKNLVSVFIGKGVTTISYDAFSHCSSLKDIVIPKNVDTIKSSAFYGCSSLTSIAIPDGVTTVSFQAFAQCTSLTSITIPDSVTSIKSYAFSGCSSLTDFTVPSKVTTIEEGVFYKCSELKNVWFSCEKSSVENITIDPYRNEALTGATRHYAQHPCQTTCDECDAERKAPAAHQYDNADDLICNECGFERPPYTPGDLDGVEGVTLDDAIYLLYYVNFPSKYPVNQPADFDSSGDTDLDDAIYLLYHVNFPSKYPLH